MEELARSGHPLAALITAAADRRFPVADGGWRRVPPWRPELEAVVSFTGHAVMVLGDDMPEGRLDASTIDGFGGAHDPRVITALAGPDAWIDSLDALLVRRGAGGTPRLVPRPDLAHHPRAQFAARIRDDIGIFGYPEGRRSALAVIGRGVAGLPEISFEIETDRRGGGTALVQDALGLVPSEQLVVAAVAPGNAASLRALLTAGFVPVGSMQLFRRDVPVIP